MDINEVLLDCKYSSFPALIKKYGDCENDDEYRKLFEKIYEQVIIEYDKKERDEGWDYKFLYESLISDNMASNIYETIIKVIIENISNSGGELSKIDILNIMDIIFDRKISYTKIPYSMKNSNYAVYNEGLVYEEDVRSYGWYRENGEMYAKMYYQYQTHANILYEILKDSKLGIECSELDEMTEDEMIAYAHENGYVGVGYDSFYLSSKVENYDKIVEWLKTCDLYKNAKINQNAEVFICVDGKIINAEKVNIDEYIKTLKRFVTSLRKIYPENTDLIEYIENNIEDLEYEEFEY